MTELLAKTPCAGLLPLRAGTTTLTEVDLGQLTSLAPYRGQAAALSDALHAAHGLAVPGPGQTTESDDAEAIWFGRALVLLAGPAPDASLAAHAALTDQSDAWAVVELAGDDAAAVLARLTPLDLRASRFPVGATARSELAHMAASVTRTGEQAFRVMVFRAFAQTLAHEMRTAMDGVAARRTR